MSETTCLSEARRASYIAIAVNLSLIVTKFTVGCLANSVSLIGDGVHSLSDLFTTIIVLAGIYAAMKPPDSDHPFGHGRAESVSAIVLGVLLAIFGFEILRGGAERLVNPQPMSVEVWMLFFVIITVAIKEMLARYSFSVARRTGSRGVHADAWHHRTDALSSLLVLIALIAGLYGLSVVDGAVAIPIGVFVIYAGIHVILESADAIMGREREDLVEQIRTLGRSVNRVEDVHHIHVHDYGVHKEISLHIRVEETIDVRRAHEIATEVESMIKERIGGGVAVHVEPMTSHQGKGESSGG